MIPFTYLSSHLLWTSSRKSVGILAVHAPCTCHVHLRLPRRVISHSELSMVTVSNQTTPSDAHVQRLPLKKQTHKLKRVFFYSCSSCFWWHVHQHNLLIWFEPGKSKLKHDLCFFSSGGGGWWDLKNNHSQSCWALSFVCLIMLVLVTWNLMQKTKLKRAKQLDKTQRVQPTSSWQRFPYSCRNPMSSALCLLTGWLLKPSLNLCTRSLGTTFGNQILKATTTYATYRIDNYAKSRES